MKKKNLLNPTRRVIIQDWLKMRPYDTPSKYDFYYLEVANQVRQILTNYQSHQPLNKLDEQELSHLACVIASYFEDYTNEIGMWQVFVQTNQDTIGKPLPFYDLTDYETDYLNRQDIEYLIWHYASNLDDGAIYYPLRLSDCAKEIFILLEDNLEDAPVNEYYDGFLDLAKVKDYPAIKDRLKWLALDSYMLGSDLEPEFSEELVENIEENNLNENSQFNAPQLTYLLAEEYLYIKRSRFNTLNAPEMLSKIARGLDAQQREEIRRLQYQHSGYFSMEKFDSEFIYFKHLITHVVYKTLRSSIRESSTITRSQNCNFVMNLIYWRGNWSMTGLLASVPQYHAINQQEEKRKVHTWMQSQDDIKQITEIHTELKQSFLKFFKTEVPLFASFDELTHQRAAFMAYHNQRVTSDSLTTQAGQEPSLVPDLPTFDHDWGLYFDLHKGLNQFDGMSNFLRNLVDFDALSREDMGDMFFELTHNFVPSVVDYILRNCPHPPLIFHFGENEWNIEPHLSYYQRFYDPDEFQTEYMQNILLA
jgi:hypothetical protein